MPRWLTRVLIRVQAAFSPGHDRELREELELHVRLLEEEYRSSGIDPAAARQRARRDFGNITRFQEASHDLFAFRALEDLARDFRYVLHEMRRRPGFTAVALFSLAIGIGAVASSFSIIDAFLLRGLPVRQPARLVAFATTESRSWGGWPYAAFTRWRDSPDSRFDVAASSDVTPVDVSLGGSPAPLSVRLSLVSGNYFQVMGVQMALGRPMTPADDAAPRAGGIAVISDGAWARWFGRQRDAVGRTIALHGVTYHIVGVVTPGFAGHSVGHPTDVWIPLSMQPVAMPGSARLRVKGAMTTRFGSLSGPTSIGVNRSGLVLVGRSCIGDSP